MLPKFIDPFKLIEQNAFISGKVVLSSMTRLTDIIHEPQKGSAEVDLKFEKIEGQSLIHEEIKADLKLICQRCGEFMIYKMQVSTDLVPVVSEQQTQHIVGNYEPLVTGGEKINLEEMIENEILLYLPMIPKHQEGECEIKLPNNIDLK